MDPRISFSNDFVDAPFKHENIYREAPVSSDFEFSVKNYSMISADEVFSQGMLLPLKSKCTKKMTLRDELLVNDDDDDYNDALPRVPKSTSSRWKERLGLRKGASKKDHKSDHSFLQRVAEEERPTFGHADKTANKDHNLELFFEGGVGCRGN